MNWEKLKEIKKKIKEHKCNTPLKCNTLPAYQRLSNACNT